MRLSIVNIFLVSERPKPLWHRVVFIPHVDFPIGGFSPPEGRLARGCKPPAFSRFLFQSAVKSAESF